MDRSPASSRSPDPAEPDALAGLGHEAETLRRATFLAASSIELLLSPLEVHEITDRVANLAVPAIADWCIVDVAGNSAPLDADVAVAHADPSRRELVREVRRAGLFEDAPESLLAPAGQDHRALLDRLGVTSAIVVPMKARGHTVGKILLATGESGRRYGPADRETAEQLATQAALMVENARRYHAERQVRASFERAAAKLTRLQAITTDLASALTSEQIAQAVIDHGTAAVGAKSGAIWLMEADGTHARMLRSLGYPETAIERYGRVPLDGPSPLADALRRQVPVFIQSLSDYDRLYPAASEESRDVIQPSITSMASLPLVIGKQALGALAFAFEGDRSLNEDERAFVSLVADHCAQALYRAKLYEAEHRARSEIALLYRLVDEISRAATLDDIYAHALEVVQEALGVDRASILLYDANNVMRFRAWRGLSDTYRKAVDGHSPWTPDVKDPATLIVTDTETDPSTESYRPIFRAEGIRALAFIPLVHQHRLIGKFMVYSAEPRAFTASELRLARSIATQVANAVAKKTSEAELEAAHRTAERASRMKDEFLAVVSHELRTPLSAIAGWTNILRSGRRKDPATIAKGLEVIDRNVTVQTKIIDDILDVSRIITGKLVVNPEPTSLVLVVDEALDSVRTSATAKEIQIVCDHDDEPFVVVGDPDRLRQIIWNLLSNAIKFTPHGGSVVVLLRRTLGSITVQVRDTGKGIAPDFLPHVFERFRQADSSTTRGHGGLGLGLAIVRHLVELHGGQVRADSAGEGQGATFTVTFPVKAVFEKAAPAESAEDQQETASLPQAASPIDLAGARVLVVDDEADAREMLKEILSHYGAVVETASSARQALEALERLELDVLVSDIGMPAEDGYALIRAVRRLPDARALIPAVALTAYARPEDARRVLDAGYERHVAKPANPDTLMEAIAELRGRGRS